MGGWMDIIDDYLFIYSFRPLSISLSHAGLEESFQSLSLTASELRERLREIKKATIKGI